jgi:hypothetical protein
MAKILNTLSIDKSISKMVEKGDELVINGHIYDKTTFAPKPLCFLPVAAPRGEMYLSKQVMLSYGGCQPPKTFRGTLADNVDPDILYVGTYGNITDSVVSKFMTTKNGYIEVKISPLGVYNSSYDFISQDSERVYSFAKRYYTADGYANFYLGSFNKQTMAYERQTNASLQSTILLNDSDTYIYYAGSKNTSFFISRYNKTNGANNILYEEKSTPIGWSINQVATQPDENNEIYIIKDGFHITGENEITFHKLRTNYVTNSVIKTDVTVDFDLLPKKKIFLSSNSNFVIYELFRHEHKGKKYLNLLMYTSGTAGVLKTEESILYTFEIVNDTNMKLINYEELAPFVATNFFTLYNNKTLVMGNTSVARIYNWNAVNESFEKGATFDFPMMAIGADSNNNLYIQGTDTSIEMISTVLPVTMYVDFEEEEYQFKGHEIQTVVEVYAKNYLGDFVTTNIDLSLSGPVKFTDTGFRKKTIVSSNLNKITIPVTVYDSGLLKVNYKIM